MAYRSAITSCLRASPVNGFAEIGMMMGMFYACGSMLSSLSELSLSSEILSKPEAKALLSNAEVSGFTLSAISVSFGSKSGDDDYFFLHRLNNFLIWSLILLKVSPMRKKKWTAANTQTTPMKLFPTSERISESGRKSLKHMRMYRMQRVITSLNVSMLFANLDSIGWPSCRIMMSRIEVAS